MGSFLLTKFVMQPAVYSMGEIFRSFLLGLFSHTNLFFFSFFPSFVDHQHHKHHTMCKFSIRRTVAILVAVVVMGVSAQPWPVDWEGMKPPSPVIWEGIEAPAPAPTTELEVVPPTAPVTPDSSTSEPSPAPAQSEDKTTTSVTDGEDSGASKLTVGVSVVALLAAANVLR